MKSAINYFKLFALILVFASCAEEELYYAPMLMDQTFEVSESIENGNIIGSLQCFDLYETGGVKFKITGGNELGIFQIDSINGTIIVIKREAIDLETESVFKLSVQALNVKGQTAVAEITIRIKRETWFNPMIADQEFALLRQSEAGTIIGKVVSLDLYSTDSLTFSIVGGNDENVFNIDSETGHLILESDDFLSKQTDSIVMLVVEVRNVKGESDNGTIIISILDSEYYAPMIQNQTYKLVNNVEAGYVLGQITAMDVYDTQKLKFRFLDTHMVTPFDLDSLRGILTVSNPDDLVGDSVFNLQIVVENIHGETATALISISVYKVLNLEYGLVLYLPFDDNMNDYSGNYNNGINYTSNNFVNGYKGSALDFNGMNDYLLLSKHIDNSNGLSFSFWMQKRNLIQGQNNGAIASMYKMTGHKRGFMVRSPTYDGSENVLACSYFRPYGYSAIGDGTASYYTQAEIAAKSNSQFYTLINPTKVKVLTWTHCVVNVTDTELQIWLDGVVCTKKEREYTEYGSFSDVPICIGNMPDAGQGDNNHFNGILDELRIYNRPLTEEEIQELYEN